VIYAGLLPPICYLAYTRDFGHGETFARYLTTYYASLALFILSATALKMRGSMPQYLGAISYSVYFFGPVAKKIAHNLVEGHSTLANTHFEILFGIVLAVLIASATYYEIESLAIQIGRRFKSKPTEELLASPTTV
jgi:peptidoglycan/LPS O-acetylase OafA/YrhL